MQMIADIIRVWHRCAWWLVNVMCLSVWLINLSQGLVDGYQPRHDLFRDNLSPPIAQDDSIYILLLKARPVPRGMKAEEGSVIANSSTRGDITKSHKQQDRQPKMELDSGCGCGVSE